MTMYQLWLLLGIPNRGDCWRGPRGGDIKRRAMTAFLIVQLEFHVPLPKGDAKLAYLLVDL